MFIYKIVYLCKIVYDIHGRELSESIGSSKLSYTYDNNGNTLTMTDITGVTTYSYDALNRVTTKIVPTIGKSTYLYDDTTNMLTGEYAEKTTDPKGNVVIKVYDKTGRIKIVTSDSKNTVYDYNADSSKSRITYPDDSTETYTYNPNNTLKSMVNRSNNGVINETFQYTYDQAKNILSKKDSKGTTVYTYDSLNRIMTQRDSVSGKTISYTYDAVGNRLTETQTYQGGNSILTYSYNDQNRLTSIVTMSNNLKNEEKIYTYDNNGNQLAEIRTVYLYATNISPPTILTTTKSTTNNTYDVFNQLIQTVTSDNNIIKNTYNGLGNRVGKEVAGKKTSYLYEGDKVILELDSLGVQQAKNVYGTSLISRTDTSTTAKTGYYFYNGHGDVSKILDSSGVLVGDYSYDAFGNITNESESINNPYRYAGYQYDKETKTYYLSARMYNPSIARFMQEDTYTGDLNDPLSLNLYTYCVNNPLIYYDPSGHYFVEMDDDGNQIAYFPKKDDSYDPGMISEIGGTLKRGSSREEVIRLQQLLIEFGYLEQSGADGMFGPNTQRAVRTFQTDNGLTADGIVGRKTWGSLTGEYKKSHTEWVVTNSNSYTNTGSIDHKR